MHTVCAESLDIDALARLGSRIIRELCLSLAVQLPERLIVLDIERCAVAEQIAARLNRGFFEL